MGLFLYSEFLNDRNEPFRIEIHDTDFSGSETEFHVGADGFVLDYQGDTEKPFQTIVGSTVTVMVQIESGSQGLNNATVIDGFLDDLRSSDEDRFTMVIRDSFSASGDVYWCGILQPEQINTADESYPRQIELTASDDLANLKGVDYNDDGSPYIGIEPILNYILNCLSKTRTTQHWGASDDYLVVSNYILGQETTGGTLAENYQLTNSDFYVNDNGITEYPSSYEMLEQICETFMWTIYQARGVWVLIPRMYVTQTGTYTGKFYDKSGTATGTSSAYNTMKLIDQTPSSRVQRLTGGEYAYLNAFKSVRKKYTFNGNIPLINENFTGSDLGVTTFDNEFFILPSGGQMVCSLNFNMTLDADSSVTGDQRAIRYLVSLTLKAGTYYLDRGTTQYGQSSVFNLADGDQIDMFTFVLDNAEWNTTSSNRLEWFTQAFDYEAGDTGAIQFGLTLPPIPADAQGLEVTIDLIAYEADGTTDGTFSDAVLADTTINFASINFYAGDDVAFSGDEIIYTANSDNNAREIFELSDSIIGDQISTAYTLGAIRRNDETYTDDEWFPISDTGNVNYILETLVNEHLAYRNVPREVLRFTLYDDVLYFDDVFSFESQRYVAMTWRFIANRGEYEVELIEMSRDGTSITTEASDTITIREPKVVIDKDSETQNTAATGAINKRVSLQIPTDYETDPKTRFSSKNTTTGKATNFGTLLRSADDMTEEVEFVLPSADGSDGDVLTTDGNGVMTWETPSGGGGGISNVVEDTTPQLGGNLDLNSNDITGTGDVDITGTLSLTNTTTDDSLLITTTEDGSDAAPVITLKRNSASTSNGDYLGQLKFKGENDADQEIVYAKITGKISDDTDTTEDGLIEFALKKAGSNNIGARLTSTELKLINGTGLEVGGYSFPTSDGTSGQVLQTDGAGTLSFQTPSGGGGGSVVIASTTTQARLNVNDRFYFGNDTYGWNYIVWTATPTSLTSTVDDDQINGIICPVDATNINLFGSIMRINGNGTDCEVRLYKAPRPNGSTSNIALTLLGSMTTGGLTSGTAYNTDISASSVSISAGDLIFVMVKKTGGTNTTTYSEFNFTLMVS